MKAAKLAYKRHTTLLTGQRRFCDVGGDDALPSAIIRSFEDLGLQIRRHLRIDR